MSASPPPKPDPHQVKLTEAPPTTVGGILRRLGPGLIVAGSIVGSGELIATTSTGAQAGFYLLWLILIGCVIKVFVQVELGRYTVTSGRTTIEAMNEVPGPRLGQRGNWLVWFWFLMFLASIAQLGGIVGGVGQALSISAPLTDQGRAYNHYVETQTAWYVAHASLDLAESKQDQESIERVRAEIDKRAEELAELDNQTARALGDDVITERGEKAFASLIKGLQSSLKEKFKPVRQADDGPVDMALFVKQFGTDKYRERGGNPNAPNEQTFIRKLGVRPDPPVDDKIWASVVAVVTMFILIMGRYGLIQSFSTTMVALFTLITIANLIMLQSDPTWGVTMDDIILGMSFRLPPAADATAALATALATFGIIGVGASELVTYPYWCIEKGYARFTGPNDGSEEWIDRARGWMRVMRWDAWCSMVVYTFATVAFYLLGASILGRSGLDPKGHEMIRYLSVMYEPVFGTVAQGLFLFGAFAVLYSTFFVANASHARVFSDALQVLKLAGKGEAAYRRRVMFFSGLFPLVCLAFFVSGLEPRSLVLFSGAMQAVMLPMLAAAALFFRYRRCVAGLQPSLVWDILLWTSAFGLLIAGSWAAYTKWHGLRDFVLSLFG